MNATLTTPRPTCAYTGPMTQNEGTVDRLLRAGAGIALLKVACDQKGAARLAAGTGAALMLVTAATGFCGIYKLLGVSTCKVS